MDSPKKTAGNTPIYSRKQGLILMPNYPLQTLGTMFNPPHLTSRIGVLPVPTIYISIKLWTTKTDYYQTPISSSKQGSPQMFWPNNPIQILGSIFNPSNQQVKYVVCQCHLYTKEINYAQQKHITISLPSPPASKEVY